MTAPTSLRLRHYEAVRLSLKSRFIGSVVERPVELWPKRELLLHPTLRLSPEELEDGIAVAQITYCEGPYNTELPGLRFRQMEQDIRQFIHERMGAGIIVGAQTPNDGQRLYALGFTGLAHLQGGVRYELAACWVVDQQTGDRWVAAVIGSKERAATIAGLRKLTDNTQVHLLDTGRRHALPGYEVQTQATRKSDRFVRKDAPITEVLDAVRGKIFF